MSKRPQSDAERSEESKRVLERVSNESETIGTSSFVRMAKSARDHMSGADADQDDAVELWGRRVGRGLSVIAFIVLAIWLVNYLTR